MAIIKDEREIKITVVNTGVSGVYLKAFLDPNNTTAAQQEITRNLSSLVLGAAIKGNKFGAEDSNLDITKKKPLLIPVLRAALPMYVVAQNMIPGTDSVLVRCKRIKGSAGKDGVVVSWMGRTAFTAESDLDGRDILLLNTVIATGDTIVKLLEEIKATIETSQHYEVKTSKCVTVLTCYASPQALAILKSHPLVKSIVVGVIADGVDDNGFLIPSTGGDMGDKLFGKEEA